MFKKLLNYINQPTTWGEIMRFVLVGGIATVIDFFVMGVTLYILDSSLYDSFFMVFIHNDASGTMNENIATGVGFLFGLVANYFLSVLFVFNNKGNSKNASGIIGFVVLSTIGFIVHEAGMSLFVNYLGPWGVKVVFTVVVLVYNYITRKLLIFRKAKATQPQTEGSEQDSVKQDSENKIEATTLQENIDNNESIENDKGNTDKENV